VESILITFSNNVMASSSHQTRHPNTTKTKTSPNSAPSHTPSLVTHTALLLPAAPDPTAATPFAPVAVALAPGLKQLSTAQLQPLMQHPPPPLLLAPVHEVHPCAQLALASVVAAPVKGTAIVTPEEIMVVYEVAGQFVDAQSRPVRQHPPP
jgi:hypothetical protein